jgi:hypothetical protein
LRFRALGILNHFARAYFPSGLQLEAFPSIGADMEKGKSFCLNHRILVSRAKFQASAPLDAYLTLSCASFSARPDQFSDYPVFLSRREKSIARLSTDMA